MSDLQFLYLDICLMTVLAIVMGRGGPSDELYSCRPPASLLALPVLGSIFIHTCMVIVFQLAALFVTTSQEWCVKRNRSATLTHAVFSVKHHPLFSSSCSFIYRYIPLNSSLYGETNLPNMENASVFYLSGFQYIILAVVVTKGYPHKKPLYHNGKSPGSKDSDLAASFNSEKIIIIIKVFRL